MEGSPLSRGGRLRTATFLGGWAYILFVIGFAESGARAPFLSIRSLVKSKRVGFVQRRGAMSVGGWGWEESASYRRDVVHKCTTDHRGIKDQGKGMPCDSFSQGTKSLRRPL